MEKSHHSILTNSLSKKNKQEVESKDRKLLSQCYVIQHHEAVKNIQNKTTFHSKSNLNQPLHRTKQYLLLILSSFDEFGGYGT